jgi:hypothetical protein
MSVTRNISGTNTGIIVRQILDKDFSALGVFITVSSHMIKIVKKG